MAGIKTVATKVRPTDFINQIEDEQKRKDCHELVRMMSDITGKPAVMWGNIIGFGTCHYEYADGRPGEMLAMGFAPRSQNLTLYLGPGVAQKGLLEKLGKHKTGKGCLYFRKLDDVDRTTLRNLIEKSVAEIRKKYRCD